MNEIVATQVRSLRMGPVDALKNVLAGNVPTELNGSIGLFRYRGFHNVMSRAGNDWEAIIEWLDNAGKNSKHTRRRYEKEALRLLLWAIIEQEKAVSSLDSTDFIAFEQFMRSPISRHPGITWIAPALPEPQQDQNDKQSESSEQDGEPKKKSSPKKARIQRYENGSTTALSDEYTPFKGPMKQESIEQTMTVLKSMYSYWVDNGYTVANPLKRRKKTLPKVAQPKQDRVLTTATWEFLYQFLLRKPCTEGLREWEATLVTLKQKQRLMIFCALYSLGVRLSELASLKMSSFEVREVARHKESIWVNVLGKGNKIRTFPVPMDFLEVLKEYRQALNSLPGYSRRRLISRIEKLAVWPRHDDHSPLILSLDGESPLAPAGIYEVVKSTMVEAVDFLKEERLAGTSHSSVREDQLERATTHWMRHTAATQLGFSGVQLNRIKMILGHASVTTTEIYVHAEDEQLVRDMETLNTLRGLAVN